MELDERLDRAAALYRDVVDDYELRDPADLTRLGKLYLRHAYLYQADCRFEMGHYRDALKRYDEAAGLFKDTASALAVFVQIINCHVFLGEPAEARTALARAAILADAIPEEAFTASASPRTRVSWKRYFAWLGESGLF